VTNLPAPGPGAPDPFGVETPEQIGIDVGEFRQGSPLSRWALARYLVGRAIAQSLGIGLLIFGLALVVLAGLAFWGHVPVLGVLAVLAALAVLGLRAMLLAVVRRLTAGPYDPLAQRLAGLVRETRTATLRELRRVGLPGHSVTLPLIAVRLLRRRRRAETVERIRRVELDRIVTPAQVDELHLILNAANPLR